MCGPRECHTKWSKPDREISYDILYMWNLKRKDKWTYLQNRKTHRLRKQTHGCWLEEMVKDFGKLKYTLLYLKWITNKSLLYTTWNSTQYYVPAWMGGGLGENRYMYMYGWIPSLSPETITILLSNYTPIQNVLGVKKQ